MFSCSKKICTILQTPHSFLQMPVIGRSSMESAVEMWIETARYCLYSSTDSLKGLLWGQLTALSFLLNLSSFYCNSFFPSEQGEVLYSKLEKKIHKICSKDFLSGETKSVFLFPREGKRIRSAFHFSLKPRCANTKGESSDACRTLLLYY